MIRGLDLSHYQGTPDFAAIKAAGFDFVILKATEGTGYVDPVFQANRRAAHAAGLIVLLYHFGRDGSPAAEAAFFAQTVAPLTVGEGIVLDDEVPGEDPIWVKAWCDDAAATLAVRALVYMNQSTRDSANWSAVAAGGDPLWLARYDGSTVQPPGGSFGVTVMKQYTDAGQVVGIAGGVDLDCFYGSDAQLLAYGLGGQTMPLTQADDDGVWWNEKVTRSDASTGGATEQIPVIQELADAKSFAYATLELVKQIAAQVQQLVARPPVAIDQAGADLVAASLVANADFQKLISAAAASVVAAEDADLAKRFGPSA